MPPTSDERTARLHLAHLSDPGHPITGVLVAIGVAQLKRGVPPTPTETIRSVKQDLNAVKGIGKRDKP